MHKNTRFWIAALILPLLLSVGHSRVWAQSSADKAAADTLFNEGKELISSGATEAACAKFEASLARVTQLGTQLALASCYEKLGRLASAWGAFRSAASTAGKARDAQRKRFAEDHATALEPQLSKLVIKVEAGYRVDNLQITRDGVEVSAAELGSPIPVDPGDHEIRATAPGWSLYSSKVHVAGLPGTVEFVVPALGKAPEKLEAPKAGLSDPTPILAGVTSVPDGRLQRRRSIGYVVGGAGLAVVGVSLVFGALASSKWSDAQAHCRDNLCDQAGLDLAGSATTLGTLSTGTFVVGAAAVGAGVYLWLTARSPNAEASHLRERTSLRLVPDLAPAQVGILLQGGF